MCDGLANNEGNTILRRLFAWKLSRGTGQYPGGQRLRPGYPSYVRRPLWILIRLHNDGYLSLRSAGSRL
jgi:hypothetical protein